MKSSNPLRLLLFAIPGICVLTVMVYLLPPVRSRVDTRLELLQADIRYRLNPPEEAVFVPQGQVDSVSQAVTATLQVLLATTDTPEPTPSPTEAAEEIGPTATPTETPPPTATATPIPQSARIDGVEYQHQHGLWNYCGPANLAMAVSFWGWKADRQEVGGYLRGTRERVDDKNVMPYEMQNYVHDQTGLNMLVRTGGDLDLMKRLIAAGFPVILEKDDVLPGIGWLGHYLLLVGYEEAAGEFISMDAYHGEGTRYPYQVVNNAWRAFNFTFLVTYPDEREAELFAILGPYVDETWAHRRSLEISSAEIAELEGLQLFFAWFNRGSSLVDLQDYAGAASAYDTAFGVYADLAVTERPWRMMWYQTGPYWAYFYSSRYHDVIALADQTLDAMNEPILEESYYWRGLAREAVGDWQGAVEDIEFSVELNPNFGPGWAQLDRMRGGG